MTRLSSRRRRRVGVGEEDVLQPLDELSIEAGQVSFKLAPHQNTRQDLDAGCLIKARVVEHGPVVRLSGDDCLLHGNGRLFDFGNTCR